MIVTQNVDTSDEEEIMPDLFSKRNNSDIRKNNIRNPRNLKQNNGSVNNMNSSMLNKLHNEQIKTMVSEHYIIVTFEKIIALGVACCENTHPKKIELKKKHTQKLSSKSQTCTHIYTQ